MAGQSSSLAHHQSKSKAQAHLWGVPVLPEGCEAGHGCCGKLCGYLIPIDGICDISYECREQRKKEDISSVCILLDVAQSRSGDLGLGRQGRFFT